MYKSNLQIFCQKKHWDLPYYETTKQGLDHQPKFTATVKVNGLTFQTPNPCGSAKEAQNQAALVAIQHFSNTAGSRGSQTSDSSASIGSLHSGRPADNQNSQAAETDLSINHVPNRIQNVYKNKLQNYAQKRSLVLPTYSSVVEGPPHAPRFKGNVTIDGRIYESAEFHSNVKDAEQDTARVALMSLPLVPSEEDEAGLFKNHLQVFAQRNGLQVPAYETNMSTRYTRPIFVSTVEIGGQVFTGQEAGSKKQAEINAARVAYNTMKDCSMIASTVTVDSSASIGSSHSDIPAVNYNSQATGTALMSDHVSKRIQNVYKNRLQTYAQKRSLALPAYSSVVEGLPHAPRFKANVTIDGHSYESTEFHSTVKDAEQDAARVALTSLMPSEEDKSSLYKNLTQVFAQRVDHQVPAYGANMSAGGPMPAFVSISTGQAFTEQESITNKQADISVDRVACNTLKDRSPIPITVSSDSSASMGPLQPDIPAANRNFQAVETSLTRDHAPKRIQNVYKNQLQNYAQKRSLALPVYSSVFGGLPHAPRFKAYVTIDGQSYESTEFHSTVKDAEQDAARVALISLVPSKKDEAGLIKNVSQVCAHRNSNEVAHGTNMSAGGHIPAFVSTVEAGGQAFIGQEARTKKHTEINADRVACDTQKDRIQTVYKNHLQSYVQKKRWALPVYSSIVEGPPHARRFKANVIVNGKGYESTKFHSIVKDAEQDAAKVALMSLQPSKEDDSGLLNNLLQVSAQRNGLEIAANVTNMSAGSPTPGFVSAMEIGGQVYTGQEAKSNKQAEINADTITNNILKDGRSQYCSHLSDTLPVKSTSEAKSNNVMSSSLCGATASSPQQTMLLPSIKDELVVGSSAESDAELQAGIASVTNGYDNKVVVYPRSASKEFKGGSVLPISDDQWIVELAVGSSAESDAELQAGIPSVPNGYHNKVVVYPRSAGKEFKGGSVLPISDDQWIAVEFVS